MGEEIEGEEQAQDSSIRASLDFVYGEAKDALRAQWAAIEAIDTKAGVLLGAIAVLTAVLLSTALEQRLSIVPAILGMIGIIFTASASVFTVLAIQVERYRIDPNPRLLARKYLYQAESNTKAQVLANLLQNFEVNDAILVQKANSLRRALILAIIGILLLAVAALCAIFADINFETLVNRIAEIWRISPK